MILPRVISFGVGTVATTGTYHIENFAYKFLSQYEKLDFIPTESAKTIMTIGALGVGSLIGREYFHAKELARMRGHY